MKQIAIIVFLAAFAGSGCMTLNLPKNGTDAKPVMIAREPTAPLPVFEDQITETNAEQKLDEMRKELDYDANHIPAPPTIIVSKPGK